MSSLRDEITKNLHFLYHEVIDPVADNLSFEKRAPDGEISAGPTVLIVGNHSSGKSTFINHFIGQQVQKTGMAPTDDCFTVLSYGDNREERDGFAAVSNPELPFNELKSFGPVFLNHFRLRLVSSERLQNVTLIDTPGMIDSSDPSAGRGYDYAGVVRWFAARADIVMVFFDPERPGTTTETLEILRTLLGNIDHKLLLVMNKMDLFRSMRDFARTYGTLCWNLARVVTKKDMPHIFTTYVPVEGAPAPIMDVEDFENARQELIQAIERSPGQRMENMITHCSLYAERLLVYATVLDHAQRDINRFRNRYFRYWFLITLLAVGGIGATWYLNSLSLSWLACLLGGTALVSTVAYYIGKALGRHKSNQVEHRLDDYFEELYSKELVQLSWESEIRRQWSSLREQIKRSLQTVGLQELKKIRGSKLKRLRKAVEKDLPSLRAQLHRKRHTE